MALGLSTGRQDVCLGGCRVGICKVKCLMRDGYNKSAFTVRPGYIG